MLEGLRGEESIAALCRREGIAESLYYSWSKEFLEAGKKRLAGDTARQANTGEVKDLRREMRDMKELVADLALENRLLKKKYLLILDTPHVRLYGLNVFRMRGSRLWGSRLHRACVV